MNWSSIWAIVVLQLIRLKNDLNVLLFHLFWPLLDVLMWGFMGTWISSIHQEPVNNYLILTLLGVFLFQIMSRGANIIISTLLEELWAQNVVNLFSLPLSMYEWIAGVILFYAITILSISFVCMYIASLLFGVSLATLLPPFLLFLFPLLLCGVWIGFTSLQVIFLWGRRVIEISFAITWILMPFSGAYYPISVLPTWAQYISKCLPMSYIFQGLREHLTLGQNPTLLLLKGTAMAIVYAVGAILLFRQSFVLSRQNGLARLEKF